MERYLHGSVCIYCEYMVGTSFFSIYHILNAQASYKCKHCSNFFRSFVSTFFFRKLCYYCSCFFFSLFISFCSVFYFPFRWFSRSLLFSVFIYLTTTTNEVFFVVLHFIWHFEIVIEPFGNGFLLHVLSSFNRVEQHLNDIYKTAIIIITIIIYLLNETSICELGCVRCVCLWRPV